MVALRMEIDIVCDRSRSYSTISSRLQPFASAIKTFSEMASARDSLVLKVVKIVVFVMPTCQHWSHNELHTQRILSKPSQYVLSKNEMNETR